MTWALAATRAQRAARRTRREPAAHSGGGARRRGATRQRRRCKDVRQPVKRRVDVSQRRARSERTKRRWRPRPTDPPRGPRFGARSLGALRQRGPQAVCQAEAAAQTRAAGLPAQEPPGRGSRPARTALSSRSAPRSSVSEARRSSNRKPRPAARGQPAAAPPQPPSGAENRRAWPRSERAESVCTVPTKRTHAACGGGDSWLFVRKLSNEFSIWQLIAPPLRSPAAPP